MSQTKTMALLTGVIAAAPAVADQGAWSQADETRAIVAEMMADAEGRSSLLQSGGTAGHDGSFFLSDPSGDFRLNVGGQIQFRYYLNFRDEEDGDGNGLGEDDFESGFQARRTKLEFHGHVFDPNLFYKVKTDFEFNEGGFAQLDDAYVGYRFDDGFFIQMGQFKLPFLREELVDSRYQLLVDRSLTNEAYNQGRSQGIMAGWEYADWRAYLAFSDGFNTENTDFTATQGAGVFGSVGQGGEADYAFTGRFEYKFAGAWDQFKDFTSMPGSEYAFLVGAAAHFEDGDDSTTQAADGDYDYFSATIDLSLEGDGWNLYAAGIGAWSNDEVGGMENSATDWGLVVQGGWFIPDSDWEIFARYDVLFPDDDRAIDDTFSTITGGVNYYWYGHAAKFSADLQWFLDSANALGARNTGIGYLVDDDDNEITLRFQFQLLF